LRKITNKNLKKKNCTTKEGKNVVLYYHNYSYLREEVVVVVG